MGRTRMGNISLTSEQKRLADDSLAVSPTNNLLIQALSAFSAATVSWFLQSRFPCLFLLGTEKESH